MHLGDVLAHQGSIGVVPGPVADAVLGIDGARALRAEIGAPRMVTGALFSGEHLAVRVGSSQPTQVSPSSGTIAGEEESHGSILGEGQA